MAHCTVDLGALHLASSCSGLEAHTSGCAYVASSGEDAKDLYGQLTSAALTSGTSDRPWIARDKDYHLAIRLSLPEWMRVSEQSVLVRSLSEALFNANLWSQLGVQASSKHIKATSVPGDHEFAISLEYDDVSATARRQHKLRADVPFYDIEPPESVQVIRLERVTIDLRFTKAINSKRRKLETSLLGALSVGSGKSRGQAELGNDMLELETSDECCNMKTACHRTGYKLPSSNQPIPARMTSLHHGSGCYSQPNIAQPPEHSATSSAPPKRSYSTNNTKSTAALPRSSEYLAVLTAVLMQMIPRSTKHSHEGISVISHESPKYLAEYFPQLWAPGYLKRVSTRAAMLPTISHALGEVCGIHARSTSLKGKLAELVRRSGAGMQEYGIEEANSTQRFDFQSALSLRLWHAIEAGAFDGAATSRPRLAVQSDLTQPHENIADEDLLEPQMQDNSPPYNIAPDHGAEDSYWEEELLELEIDSCTKRSRGRHVLGSLEHIHERSAVDDNVDHSAHEAKPCENHEDFLSDDDGLSSICESVDSLALAEHMVVAEQQQISNCGIAGAGEIATSSPSAQPVLADMDDDMLVI